VVAGTTSKTSMKGQAVAGELREKVWRGPVGKVRGPGVLTIEICSFSVCARLYRIPCQRRLLSFLLITRIVIDSASELWLMAPSWL
jgi:hypothetical protein